jgi:hypothetical protein
MTTSATITKTTLSVAATTTIKRTVSHQKLWQRQNSNHDSSINNTNNNGNNSSDGHNHNNDGNKIDDSYNKDGEYKSTKNNIDNNTYYGKNDITIATTTTIIELLNSIHYLFTCWAQEPIIIITGNNNVSVLTTTLMKIIVVMIIQQ